MDQCGTWRSAYRFVLELLNELNTVPQFADGDLLLSVSEDRDAVIADARWDVLFVRIGFIQEYGFHSGIEELMWATDHLNGALTELDWPGTLNEIASKSEEWAQAVTQHAQNEHVFFPEASQESLEVEELV